MVGKELARAPAATGELLEETRHFFRVVSRVVQHLRAQKIRLALCVAGELEEHRSDTQLRDHISKLAGGAVPQDRSKDGQRKLRGLGLSDLVRGVAHDHVTNFVTDHAG